ncbi:unnamed protein product [Darwinula stevensoni]|uniref:Uncharacterized protein n=1 Tax=Darwinula stevensoni TaxID=69355 RepID=A0A7R8XA61_9CRUS|nr:unnamed protein product [Darwinula stevensoni]CAG0889907.1 unnamed protein product [Darwinula stevensoni]
MMKLLVLFWFLVAADSLPAKRDWKGDEETPSRRDAGSLMDAAESRVDVAVDRLKENLTEESIKEIYDRLCIGFGVNRREDPMDELNRRFCIGLSWKRSGENALESQWFNKTPGDGRRVRMSQWDEKENDGGGGMMVVKDEGNRIQVLQVPGRVCYHYTTKPKNLSRSSPSHP